MSFIERVARLLGFAKTPVLQVTSDVEATPEVDEKVLELLAGAQFGPDVTVVLPTGRTLTGEEVRALSAFYAPDAEEPRRPS